MSEPLPPWLANVDPRFVRHDWKKWVRPDWQRWMPPGTRFDAKPPPRSEFARLYKPYRDEPSSPQRRASGLTEADLLAFRCNLSALRFKLALLKWRIKAGFNPDQPRVPAGNPDGGQWTSGEAASSSNSDIQSSSAVIPPLAPRGRPVSNLRREEATSDVGRTGEPVQVIAARRAPGLDAECEFQYRQDTITCTLLRSRACHAQAALRYANCLAGLPIPPLNF